MASASVQRGDVRTERLFSPPLPPPPELPVPDVASPPSTLTLRACVRAAEVAARSSALLLLGLLPPLSLSGFLGLRSRPGARPSTSAPDAARQGVRREGGLARV